MLVICVSMVYVFVSGMLIRKIMVFGMGYCVLDVKCVFNKFDLLVEIVGFFFSLNEE